MPLKLICGPTGSGKTTRAIEAFLAAIDRGDSAVFIAPSKPDRLHFERRVLEVRPVLTSGSIMTFDELLTEIISNEESTARVIGQTERFLLLRAIVNGAGSPQTLSASCFFDGFITELIKLIDELESVGIRPGQLGGGLKGWAGGDSWRRGFNKDLFRIYTEYENVLAEKGVEDAARMQRRAVDNLAVDHSLLEYQSIIVDGFHDFTDLQMDLLGALRDAATELVVTLPYKAGKAALSAPAHYFDQLKPGAEIILLEENHDDRRAPVIQHIADNLFEEKSEQIKAGDSVTVLQAAGVRGQAELVAAEVLKLWREDSIGLDDMAVVTHGHGSDSLAIASAFADYGIPFEMPAPIPLVSTPVGRTALAALELVSALERPEADDGGDKLLAYLRSPLPVADRDKVDSFDKYIRSHGSDNLEVLMLEWKTKSDQPLDEVHKLLEACLRGGIDTLAAELINIMRRLVQTSCADASQERIEVDTRALAELISTFEEVALAEGITCDYPAHYLIADDVTPGSRMAHRLSRVIEMASVRLQTGSKRNCVRLLDPHRVLNQRFDAIFVCGLLEGQFPSMGREGAFLTEGDRIWLRENAGIPLEQNSLRLEEERFLFQRTLTRARHKIYLCYPYCDQEGKPTVPSLFIDDTLELFEKKSWAGCNKRIGDVAFKLQEAPTEQQALLSLASMNPGKATGTATAVLDELNRAAASIGLEQRLKHCLESRVPDWAELGEEVKKKLAEREYFHVTELERYLACPFRYFVEKLVKPQPLEIDDFFLMRGSVVHEILCSFYEQFKPGKVTLDGGDKRLMEQARRVMSDLVMEKSAKMGDDLRSTMVRNELARDLDRFIDRELIMRPEFEPHELEWSFGICDAGLPDEKTMINLGDFMLCGRVDRIDIRGHDGSNFKNQAVVIDYKTGSDKALPPQKKYEEDCTIQLPLYMYAVHEILGLEVLGGEYYGVLGRRRRGLYLDEFADILGKESSEPFEKDYVDEDTFTERLETARKQAIEAAAGIRAGDFKCAPEKETCRYCSYDCLCRSKADEWPDWESENG